MQKNNRNNLNRNLYLSIAVLSTSGFLLYWFLNHAFISFEVSPRDSVVTIDNAPVRLSRTGKVRKVVTPGLHTIQIEADGFTGFADKMELKRSQRKAVKVTLPETPKPTEIAENGQYMVRGDDFNTTYYLGNSGRTLYKAKLGIDDGGNIEIKSNVPITDQRLDGIDEIVWSPNFELALFRKQDGIYLFDFKKYDFINQTETKWGEDIGSIAWAPDNSKIAYYYAPKSGEKSLIFANASKSEATRVANLADMNIENPVLRWSKDSEWLIVIPRSSSDYSLNNIFLFNAYSREFKEITQTGDQIDAQFAPDNNKILYSTFSKDPENPVSSVLSIADKDGANQKSLNIRAEIRKTAWLNDGKNLVVATFNETSKKESIFGFNTENKEKAKFTITSVDTGYITNLFMSDDEKIVFYETAAGVFALKVE